MILNNNEINIESFFKVLKRILFQFYGNLNSKLYYILFIIFFIALIDVLTFASVVPIIYLIGDTSSINNIEFINIIYNWTGVDSKNEFIFLLLLFTLFVFSFKNLLAIYLLNNQYKFSYLVSRYLMDRQYRRFYNTMIVQHTNRNTIDFVRYIATGSVDFAVNLLMPLFSMIYDFLILIIIFAVFLIYKPLSFVLVVCAFAPITFFITKALRSRIRYYSNKKGYYEKSTLNLTIEGVRAHSDILLYNKEDFYIKKILHEQVKSFDVDRKVLVTESMPRRIIEVVIILVLVIFYLVAYTLLNYSNWELFLIMIAFATAAYRAMPAINDMLHNYIRIKSHTYILDFLDFFNPVENNLSYQSLKMDEKLELKNVCFSYHNGDSKILDNLNLTISKGEFVIISGESGAGKSTLLNILCGFIAPDEGNYLIDGHKVEHINQIKNLIGYIPQNVFLFNDSIINNIAFGESENEIDVDRVNEIVKLVNLEEFVRQPSVGLSYSIGENGCFLSGGQKQRLAIARALYRNAEILILDEITNALDKENEEKILVVLSDLSKKLNLTIVLVAHKLSNLTFFDHVYHLKNGQIK